LDHRRPEADPEVDLEAFLGAYARALLSTAGAQRRAGEAREELLVHSLS